MERTQRSVIFYTFAKETAKILCYYYPDQIFQATNGNM